MTKTRNWPTRVLHVVFALALVVGLAVTAAPPVAEAGPADPGTFVLVDGEYTLTGGAIIDGWWARTTGTTVGPRVVSDARYALWMFGDPDTDDPDYRGSFSADFWIGASSIYFAGEYSDDVMDDFSLGTIHNVVGSLTIAAGGGFTLEYSAESDYGDVYFRKTGYMYKPQIDPRLAFNVKYATHKVCVNYLSYQDDPMANPWIHPTEGIDWWLTGKKGLTKADITVIEPSGENPDEAPRVFGETMKERGLYDNVPCIEVQAKAPGDVDFDVEIKYINPETQDYYYLRFEAEKKYFDIARSELDLEPGKPGVTNTMTVDVPGGATSWRKPQKMVDTIWGLTPGYAAPQLVDDAMVHWWLLKDTPENKIKIRSLMQYIADHDESGHGFYEPFSAAGTYGPFEEFMVDPANPGVARQPWGWIMDWATTAPVQFADPNLFRFADVDYDPSEVVDTWYARSTSLNGKADAYIQVNQSELKPCIPQSVMIVVLVTYPGVDPTWDPANGQNRIAIQIAQKTYHKDPVVDPIVTPKTPQLRWASEPIVLEHDWGMYPTVSDEPWVPHEIPSDNNNEIEPGWKISGTFYAARYANEQQSIGSIDPIADMSTGLYIYSDVPELEFVLDLESISWPTDSQGVIAPLGGGLHIQLPPDDDDYPIEWWTNSISRAMLTSEVSGEADVNASLYEIGFEIRLGYCCEIGPIVEFEAWAIGPIAKQGFLVYFLDLEDIELSDVTPPGSLGNLTPDQDDAHVAVQVRGYFDYRHSHLPATTRPEKVVEVEGSDYGYILPAGRYVLPDDWVLLARTNRIVDRPHWDLMDSAHHDDIYSLNPLGHYNQDVRTTDPPDEARFPTVGPFSTLQLWHEDAMWISDATVPTSMPAVLPLEDARNTVVPDGLINKWDAPMPPALVIFQVDRDQSHPTASLSELWKCMLEGYGYTIYDSGTATANTGTTTLTDSAKSWIPGDLVNGFVMIDRGGEYSHGRITANTATTLTFTQVDWPATLPLPPAPGVRSGDAYWIPRFESPFYAVEIPASPYIPTGYPGWQSWGWNPDRVPGEMVTPIDGPYPFWADLQMETRWMPATEPNPHEIWVYSDNHGIAGVTIDALSVQDCVTITAKADHPYTPKYGKYGPVYSDDIIACWGPPPIIEMNPWFLVDKTEVEVGETVTFTNETWGGVEPYVSALWEFGDGETSTEAVQRGETVTHVYTAPGPVEGYTVSLTMTDQQDITRKETRLFYIKVTGDPNDNDDPVYVDNPLIGEGLASIAGQIQIVYVWRPVTQSWDMYWPAAGINDIGTLQAGTAYWIRVESDCTLEYGTRSYELLAGWNNIAWLPQ